MASMMGRYEEECGEAEGEGISISVCVNSEEPGLPPQTTTLLTVSDRRLPHQRSDITKNF